MVKLTLARYGSLVELEAMDLRAAAMDAVYQNDYGHAYPVSIVSDTGEVLWECDHITGDAIKRLEKIAEGETE
jgi:hypothetical protein